MEVLRQPALLPPGDLGAPSRLCPGAPGSSPLASSQDVEEGREYGAHGPPLNTLVRNSSSPPRSPRLMRTSHMAPTGHGKSPAPALGGCADLSPIGGGRTPAAGPPPRSSDSLAGAPDRGMSRPRKSDFTSGGEGAALAQGPPWLHASGHSPAAQSLVTTRCVAHLRAWRGPGGQLAGLCLSHREKQGRGQRCPGSQGKSVSEEPGPRPPDPQASAWAIL